MPHWWRVCRPGRWRLHRRRRHRSGSWCSRGRAGARQASSPQAFWLASLPRARSRRELYNNRIRTQSRWLTGRLDHLKSFSFRLVAIESESNRRGGVDWQCKRAWRTAGLAVGCLRFRTGWFRFQTYGLQRGPRFKRISLPSRNLMNTPRAQARRRQSPELGTSY